MTTRRQPWRIGDPSLTRQRSLDAVALSEELLRGRAEERISRSEIIQVAHPWRHLVDRVHHDDRGAGSAVLTNDLATVGRDSDDDQPVVPWLDREAFVQYARAPHAHE